MKTYSFSTSGNAWKTRYSFMPDCYAAVDNYFVSFKESSTADNTNTLCWVHNKNHIRNKFYNTVYPSQITVVSNDNPSMEKVFNAVSIESNQNLFLASVSTNIDISENSITKNQMSVVSKFFPKEEALYSNIGPSLINSTKNTSVVGLLGQKLYIGNQPASAQQLKNIGLIDNINPNTYYVAVQLNSDSIPYGLPNSIKIAFSKQPYEQVLFVKKTPTGYEEVLFEPQQCYNNSVYNLVSVRLFNDLIYAVFSFSSANYTVLYPSFPGLDAGNVIYAVSDSSINGDSIRGKYAMITIQTLADGKPFEIYAINTEFSPSKLDASS